LFSAFVVVWLGLFIYLYGLVRRSRSLEDRIAELARRSGSGK
jgi:CcmD family protein